MTIHALAIAEADNHSCEGYFLWHNAKLIEWIWIKLIELVQLHSDTTPSIKRWQRRLNFLSHTAKLIEWIWIKLIDLVQLHSDITPSIKRCQRRLNFYHIQDKTHRGDLNQIDRSGPTTLRHYPKHHEMSAKVKFLSRIMQNWSSGFESNW